jgi:hypothetical protein
MDTERNVFLYGAIKVENHEAEESKIFTEETWTVIYEKIKEYFPDAEIVGWYYGGTGFGPEDLKILEQIQVNNFAGRDKVLLTYDVLEKENNFYLFDGISMVLQSGYYIYYEKNLEMQSYMVDHKKVKREEEEVDDHATIKMRTILNEKKPPAKKDNEQKFMLRLGYAAGAMVLIVALIVGVTMIGNNVKMKELESDIQTMKQNIFEKQSQDEDTNLFSEITKSPTITSTPKDIDIIITPTEAPVEMTPTIIAVTPTEKPKEITPTVTIAPTPAPTQKPVMSYDPESLVEYTIKDGDTLASICVRECGDYGMLSAVKDLNQIKNEDVIYVGQVILIPKK